jgi:4-hydroxybenzoate polyprenyltransferase
MTNTNFPLAPISAAKNSALRYLSCLRPQDILVLQGPPLLGAAFAFAHSGTFDLSRLALLITANVFLVSHIFLLNDWSGLTADYADPNKASRVFTARGVSHGEIAVLTAGVLVVSLVLFSQLGVIPCALALAIALLSGLYSVPRFDWKGRPLFNSIAHLAGGLLHFLLGYTLANALDPRGLATAMYFALIFVAGHLTQEVRDYEGDATSSIRTNAVAFGKRRTFIASLILFGVAHILLFVLASRGTIPHALAMSVALFGLQVRWSLQALREGLTYRAVCRLQDRYRVLYAVIGGAIVAALFIAPLA